MASETPRGPDTAAVTRELRQGAGAVARAGLADAFGHVSVRRGTSISITRAVPLAVFASDGEPVEVALDAVTLPTGAPMEAWLHVALAAARPEIGAVVRAQPPAVAAFATLRRELPILHGHGALLGGTHLVPDSILVRERPRAERIAAGAAGRAAIILAGNGAVTVGADLAQAVARMWVLEASARLALDALSAGEPVPLPAWEVHWWTERASELLPRIYAYLTTNEAASVSVAAAREKERTP
ncbi:class II aldolase/adducin family protein [Microbacterium sp. RD1]|uniref:class II aldolase/adducin family protein n=1 Tax=Microbacterium sp. RD1 TaxID=3457313 RepID=UPI003FA6038B